MKGIKVNFEYCSETMVGIVLDKYSTTKVDYVPADSFDTSPMSGLPKIPIAVKKSMYMIGDADGEIYHVPCSCVISIAKETDNGWF